MGRTKINQGPISIAYGSDQITGYFICVKDTRLEYSPNVPPGVDKVVELVEQKQGYGGYFDLHTGLQGGFGFQVSLETILYYWEKYGVPKKDIEMARKGGDVGVMRNLRDLQNCDGNTQVPKKVPSLKSRYPTRLVKGYLFAKDASSPQPVTVEVEKLPAKNGEQAYEDPNYGVRKLLHLSPSSSFMCTAIYSSDSVRGGGDYMVLQLYHAAWHPQAGPFVLMKCSAESVRFRDVGAKDLANAVEFLKIYGNGNRSDGNRSGWTLRIGISIVLLAVICAYFYP